MLKFFRNWKRKGECTENDEKQKSKNIFLKGVVSLTVFILFHITLSLQRRRWIMRNWEIIWLDLLNFCSIHSEGGKKFEGNFRFQVINLVIFSAIPKWRGRKFWKFWKMKNIKNLQIIPLNPFNFCPIHSEGVEKLKKSDKFKNLVVATSIFAQSIVKG